MARLFVRNFIYATQISDLETLFAPFGSIKSIHICKDATTGNSRGFGYIELATDEEAQKAIVGLNQKLIEGRSIHVEMAQPRKSA